MYDYYNSQQRRCPPGSFAYTVRRGDTLFEIARTFGVTVQSIININPGIDPNRLQVGQIICIPGRRPVPPTPLPPCPGGFYYEIRRGDTLFEIAQRYNVSVNDLIRANPGIDPNRLQVGQIICIPPKETPLPPCPGGFYYEIRRGDTLFEIAQRYNVSVNDLIRANPGIDPNRLEVGQIICIPPRTPVPPTPLPPCPGGFYYEIRRGDTLFEIAKRYNVPLNDLIRANPGIDPNRLEVGQIICIPGKTNTSPQPSQCPGGEIYIVKADDSLATILLKYDISLNDLIASNPGFDPDRLFPGQRLCIISHESRTCPEGTRSYLITKSDIPDSGPVVVALAEKFVVDADDIMISNPNLAPSEFTVGTRICIPTEEVPV